MLVSGHGATIHGGNIIMACVVGAFSFQGVVVAGASGAPVLCLLGERRLNLPSPLDAMRNSSVESSTAACYGIDGLR
jgi:hypothetical protein